MNDNNKSEPATKADLQELEQKLTGRIYSVETTVKSIAIELAKTQEDVRQIKNDMSTKDDISRIMNHIDAFAAEASAYRNHDTLRGGKIMEHETKLENHETRLSELETNPR